MCAVHGPAAKAGVLAVSFVPFLMGAFLRQKAKEMQKEVVPDLGSQSLELNLSHMTTLPERELRSGVFDFQVNYE